MLHYTVRDPNDGYYAFNSFGTLLLSLGIVLFGYVCGVHYLDVPSLPDVPAWLETYWAAALLCWLAFAVLVCGTSYADKGTRPSIELRFYMSLALVLGVLSIVLGFVSSIQDGVIIVR